jgi:hypothetical protein
MKALTALFILLSLLIQPHPAFAQGAPDAVFSVGYGHGGTLSGQFPATSWSDTYNYSYLGSSGPSVVSGSATSTTLNSTTSVHLTATGASSSNITAEQYFLVYVIGRSSADVTITHTGSASVTADSNKSNYARSVGSSTVDAATSAPGSDSDSYSGGQTLHFDPACNAAQYAVPGYSGVFYAKLGSSNLASPNAYANTAGGGVLSTLDASAGVDISVVLGASSPAVSIVSPTVGGISKPYPDLNDSFVLSNTSSDPDNVTGTGICSYQWSIQKPDGTLQTGGGSTITISGTIPGEYNATLTVTDNEGDTNSASTPIVVGERLIQNGNTEGPQYCAKTPDQSRPTTCVMTAMSGNARVKSNDPVSTRGYPLVNNIHLNT